MDRTEFLGCRIWKEQAAALREMRIETGKSISLLMREALAFFLSSSVGSQTDRPGGAA